tara:strand:- start:181 stop:408 length:228 start_codon:yes stop_codon:yes gene_type:complete
MDQIKPFLTSSNGESIADILASIRDELIKMNTTSKIQTTPNIFDLLGKSMSNNQEDEEDEEDDDDDDDDEEEEDK